MRNTTDGNLVRNLAMVISILGLLCAGGFLAVLGPQLYFHLYPEPAPSTTSPLIQNNNLSASFKDVLQQAGVHDIVCVPHGNRSEFKIGGLILPGWDCTGHTLTADNATGDAFKEDVRIRSGYMVDRSPRQTPSLRAGKDSGRWDNLPSMENNLLL